MKKITLILALFLTKSTFSQSKLENLGSTINSKKSEFRPILSADGKHLYFVVEKSNVKTGNKSTDHPQEVWFSSLNADGSWGKAEKCSEPINNAKNDNAVFWSSIDGSKILIRGTYNNGKYQGRGFSFCKKNDNGWSQPEAVKIKGYNNLSIDKYDGASLTNDGKTMLLYLSEEKNSWLNDIYVSQQESENEWSFPKKIISDSISIDDYDEIAPYIAADGITMYFASDRPGGHGGYDIWMTKRLDDTWLRWSSPVNVGDSVNSDKWEAYFTLDAKAEYGYLSTTRNSIGGIDLCKIKLSDNQKPKAVILLQGKLYNADNNETISNIEVTSAIEGSNDTKAIQLENQTFKTILPYGNKYIISAKGDGFETVTQTLDLSVLAPYQEMHKDLYMHPIKKDTTDNPSKKDSLNENQNQSNKVEAGNDIDSINKQEKTNKSEEQTQQIKGEKHSKKSIDNTKKVKGKNKANKEVVDDNPSNQDLTDGKSKDNSEKGKGKKKANKEVVNDNPSNQDLTDEKSKDNSEKGKGKNTKRKELVTKTEKAEQSKETENSNKDNSEKKNSAGKKQNHQIESDKSDSKEISDKNIDQVTKDKVENGEVFAVNNILFDFAKSDLKETSYKELNKVVELMQTNEDVTIELSAHTDNVGSDKYNLSLSKARAKSSKKYLVSKGISSKRITSKGYGERKPIASNKTTNGRMQNRRVEIKIISKN